VPDSRNVSSTCYVSTLPYRTVVNVDVKDASLSLKKVFFQRYKELN